MAILNNEQPTSKKSSNIIDLAFVSTNILDITADFQVDTNTTLSDHHPISFYLSVFKEKTTINKINWMKFKHDCDELFKNKTSQLINTEMELDAISLEYLNGSCL
jgi:hypothetical protein